jgi:methyltransferase
LSPLPAVLLLVVAQRLLELAVAERNTRRLLARGAVEHGRGHYPLFVLLHSAWLVALVVAVPWEREPSWWLLGLYLLLQPMRVWCIWSLGDRWTTRVIVPPGAAAVRRGPYRWLGHPNYLVVALELAVLPLAFGAWAVAIVFTALNALLLRTRIGVENAALGAAGKGGPG